MLGRKTIEARRRLRAKTFDIVTRQRFRIEGARVLARAALVAALVGAGVLLGACAGPPALSLPDVAEVKFTALESGETYLASETQVRQFVEHYAEASRMDDDGGTTAPARVDIRLRSGESLVVWGGGEPFQTVGWAGRQYNVNSVGLHRMLQGIASDGSDSDGKPNLLIDQIESLTVGAIPPGTDRLASDDEIRRVVDAYKKASVLDQRFETTPPARIEIKLKTGHRVTIWGGGLPYPMVQFGSQEFNIDSPELVLLLNAIADEAGGR